MDLLFSDYLRRALYNDASPCLVITPNYWSLSRDIKVSKYPNLNYQEDEIGEIIVGINPPKNESKEKEAFKDFIEWLLGIENWYQNYDFDSHFYDFPLKTEFQRYITTSDQLKAIIKEINNLLEELEKCVFSREVIVWDFGLNNYLGFPITTGLRLENNRLHIPSSVYQEIDEFEKKESHV